jgi:hypothetical protein
MNDICSLLSIFLFKLVMVTNYNCIYITKVQIHRKIIIYATMVTCKIICKPIHIMTCFGNLLFVVLKIYHTCICVNMENGVSWIFFSLMRKIV